MNKKEIKNILISMRKDNNEALINTLLGKIDMMDENTINKIIEQIGDNEESIRRYLQAKLEKGERHHSQEHIPINEMFTYGLAGSCIHLHLPGDLHQIMSEKGISATMSEVNLQLLDAIDRIKRLRDDGFYKFTDKDSIYMISPILIGREVKFLDEMGFTTQTYKRKQLNDEEFVKVHPEAQLAIHIFSKDRNVATASIRFETIDSKEWQDKKMQKVKELKEKGIKVQQENKEKE